MVLTLTNELLFPQGHITEQENDLNIYNLLCSNIYKANMVNAKTPLTVLFVFADTLTQENERNKLEISVCTPFVQSLTLVIC